MTTEHQKRHELARRLGETPAPPMRVPASNEGKREYVWDAKKMYSCPHRRMDKIIMGGNWYRCADCNAVMDIVGAYVQSPHHMAIAGALQLLHFAKVHGSAALKEVLTKPIGQEESDHQMAVLPPGMTLQEAAELLDQIDVNTPDQGLGQLRALQEAQWVTKGERVRKALQTGQDPANILGTLTEAHGSDTRPRGLGAGDQGPDGAAGREVPSVRQRKKPRAAGGDSREP